MSFKLTKHGVRWLFNHMFSQIMALREDGQKEYAHEDDRPFRNFERDEQLLQLPRYKTQYVFLNKHLDGIVAYINGHRSQREDVRGRLKDVIVYLLLLYCRIEEDEGYTSLTNTQMQELQAANENLEWPSLMGKGETSYAHSPMAGKCLECKQECPVHYGKDPDARCSCKDHCGIRFRRETYDRITAL